MQSQTVKSSEASSSSIYHLHRFHLLRYSFDFFVHSDYSFWLNRKWKQVRREQHQLLFEHALNLSNTFTASIYLQHVPTHIRCGFMTSPNSWTSFRLSYNIKDELTLTVSFGLTDIMLWFLVNLFRAFHLTLFIQCWLNWFWKCKAYANSHPLLETWAGPISFAKESFALHCL